MGSEELDKLFQTKLEGLTTQPSKDAWSAVQTRLNGKNRAWFYLRIAAAILLLITFGALYFLNDRSATEITNKSITDKTIPLVKSQPIDTLAKDSIDLEQKIPALKQNDKQIAAVDTTDTTRAIKDKSSTQKIVTQQPSVALKTKEIIKKKSQEENDSIPTIVDEMFLEDNRTLVAENENMDATSETEIASNPQKESESGSTIVFDIEDFDMKTAVTSAYEAAEETKKSGFKKVLDFVKSVKEGETGLGGLREAKNNLLSIKQKEKKDDNSR
ncbi:MAG: hypothetical protein AAF843_01845 [Bacteroidota bacterium]